MVEENYFGECRLFIVGKAYGCGNVFLLKEGVHAKFEVNVSIRDVFRISRAVGRGSG
jgi:hypothetical protein